MSVIYVREHHAVVRKQGESLRVTEGEQETLRVPLVDLEQLILMGNAQLTTPAAVMLLNAGVDVVFMSRYGKYRGRLTTNGSKFAELRHQQLRLCDDPERTLDLARQIVVGKISNQRVVLQRRAEEIPDAANALRGMLTMLDAAENARDLDQLRGFEGKAAAWYFGGVRTFFTEGWGFTSREYHPPPDPVNALLSFAYTLLLKDVEAKIQLVGLDPYLGFFHTLGYNRPALALDVMEEFRPSIADIVVLTAISDQRITLDDFAFTGNPEAPVRMSPEAVEQLVLGYETRLSDRIFHPLQNGQVDYRRAIELQVRQMARLIRGEDSFYTPLTMR